MFEVIYDKAKKIYHKHLFRHATRMKGGDEKDALIELALRNQMVLRIQYLSKKGYTRTRTVDALYFDRSGNLRAWDHEEKDYRTFCPNNIFTAQWTGEYFETTDRKIPVLDENYRIPIAI